MTELTPRAIVAELDKHIVGQQAAKRAVAVALRNRWRRLHVDSDLRPEITPKNILMIGPTGVGKTEIARRLAKLAEAPFIKVEATKFTEVGYVGRDVESIIRDLVDTAIKLTREKSLLQVRQRAEAATEDRLLEALLPGSTQPEQQATVDKMRSWLREGKLEEREINIEVSLTPMGVEIMGPPGMEEMTGQLQQLFQNMAGQRTKPRRLKVRDARRILTDQEAAKLVNEEEIKLQALDRVEQQGIVFIDEIDKIAKRGDHSGPDVSREGVQRDLLPLIEGCTVTTKYGAIKTDHILFITSGAFHLAKPSDLIPELQGRLPLRVEMTALTVADFVRILTEPDASLVKQYRALLATEGVTLEFTPESITQLAEIAWQVNEQTENIGARRLHTVLERLLENISFDADQMPGNHVVIDAAYVEARLADLARNQDLTRYIL